MSHLYKMVKNANKRMTGAASSVKNAEPFLLKIWIIHGKALSLLLNNIRKQMKSAILSVLCLATLTVQAQKKPLDHTVYDQWQSIGNTVLSPKGNVLTYEICPQEGDTTLIVRNNRNGRQLEIPRGCRARILDNEEAVICIIKPFFKDIREAKIKKTKADDMPKDSLAIISLPSFNIRKFAAVKSFQLGLRGTKAVAFLSSDTILIPKKERKDKDFGSPLLIYNLQSGHIDTLRHVAEYTFDRRGDLMAYTLKEGKNRQMAAVYDVNSRQNILQSDTMAFVSLPTFNKQGTEALFLSANDTLSSGSKHCSLWLANIHNSTLKCLTTPENRKNMPEGWGLTENSSPQFSHNGQHIFTGIQPFHAPRDTTLVPFETAELDIWNYNAPELPPMTKVNLKRDQKRTCLTSVDHDGTLHPLTTSFYDHLSLIDRGDAPMVLSTDMTAAMVSTQWDEQPILTASLVNIANGTRTEVTKARFERVVPSTKGRFLAWFDLTRHHWMLYDVNRKTTRNLTEGLNENFWNEEDDHPMLPEAYGIGGWTADDKYLLLYDRYDIWAFSTTDGKAQCLTRGEGRKHQRTYRYIDTRSKDDDPGILKEEKLLLSVFDNKTKERGISTTTLNGALKDITLEGYSQTSFMKARETDVYAYRRGNFQHPMDIYLTKGLRSSQQLSHINPQQQDYLWGTAELFHWNAYDGTLLDGLLYKPENFDPEKKYPVMIYFYEKRSDNLYAYYPVAPSRSIINIPFFVSRGYVVFVPDIVYRPGTPGESAYNCIVSGAEALAQNSWIDRENMAIQGQSWGGYQVAYLITRTNLFKAAGAGAPVSNMTSAYGGIRWESGMSRQFQYEQSQSRIGRDLWHGIELYMENSPLFKLPEVQTPVLIMHNDNDGAVPWYQGIEMFMGLRRLGKPAWLLEYNNEAHNLKERRNCKDLSIRLQQFFDHYLKGAPAPAWMTRGVPTLRKGQYFGFETE